MLDSHTRKPTANAASAHRQGAGGNVTLKLQLGHQKDSASMDVSPTTLAASQLPSPLASGQEPREKGRISVILSKLFVLQFQWLCSICIVMSRSCCFVYELMDVIM
jgi:hypothetical protein